MIPSVVARQTRETVLDYLRTTFALADPEFEDALFSFLDSEGGLFRGPYFDIRLPFRKAGKSDRLPLDIRPDFTPYKHQQKAFQRLFSKDGHQPQHTLVTTGTGSGKTECFLYPILDHCWRNRETPGIKAIILYPMNALATDQARRLAKMLWDDDRLKGNVTAGLYVGGQGQHGAADREHLVDKREVLRASPPDILLTNYRMLDFLLLRPDDRDLWKHNGPGTLRYLALDELHTYDGAQGSDVACLIRRLKSRLNTEAGSLCAVGTSATIGGGAQRETIDQLTRFATKVFDEPFFEDAVITEDRYQIDEVLPEESSEDGFPSVEEAHRLRPENFESAEDWSSAQASLWFGPERATASGTELGALLDRHEFLRVLLRALAGQPRSFDELDAQLEPKVPEWGDFDEGDRQRLIESFVSLVSRARKAAPTPDSPDRDEPYLAVHAQVWLRELRRLVQRVLPAESAPQFAWSDEGGEGEHENHQHWLPIAHCRDCGAHGWAAFQRTGEMLLQTDVAGIGRSWLNRARTSTFVGFGHDEHQEGFPEGLCPTCLRVQLWGDAGQCDQCQERLEGATDAEPVALLPTRLSRECSDRTPPRYLARCPDCETDDTLSMLGSRAPSLLSVAISHLYQSDYNNDKKLLAFTDSVQDASHRSGFFGARTYRFNLRTAMQSVIEEAGDAGISLADFADELWSYWERTIEPDELIPTLMPADLFGLDEYLDFQERGGGGRHSALISDLKDRLSWEVVMEYGLNARVGRTLETTLCSTVEVDLEAIRETASVLALELNEGVRLAPQMAPAADEDDLVHFLSGLLNRLRLRGGIDHPMLGTYVRERGRWFHLTKRRQRLMSPFGGRSVLPRFITNTRRAAGDTPVFDSFMSRPKPPYTWTQDWAARSLHLDPEDPAINDLYAEAFSRLEASGLVVRHDMGSGTAYAFGLNRTRLKAIPSARSLRCPECRRSVTLSPEEADAWTGRICTQYRCEGRLEAPAAVGPSYYGRIYRSGRLKRIFSQEHTGLLSREDREAIEEEFKSGEKPGAVNLFVCTPTLEMGIDIGDLSAAVLCSVPPTTSNYLQRIGRAGRSTGNAFTLTLANSRPHDLYFHAQPEEMMAGQVLPPGCFLDAPEMLQRQMIAHAMDAWAREEREVNSIPRETKFVLSESGRAAFPGRFVEFYRERREKLVDEFLEQFKEYLSLANRTRLMEFSEGETVPRLVDGAFDKIETELKEIRNQQDKAKRRLTDIENNPDGYEDPEEEKKDIEEARRVLGRLADELRSKYPLNVLTDEGVLPNYAFPEPGVKLESVVSQRGDAGKTDYQAHEYMRPASSAIRELAPFNTFYAEGRKVQIDEIDVGSRARPMREMWRLCQECSYMRLELPDDVIEAECPRCRDTNWADGGQARSLIHFRRSRSLATRLEASTTDETEDRDSQFYKVLDLVDVGPENYNGAKLIEEIPFGFELLKNLRLREINFGLEAGTSTDGFKVRGDVIGDKGFDVCTECGRVRQKEGDDIRHSAGCKFRGRGQDDQSSSEKVFLYREIESEALRILLPVSEVGLETKRASFKAALQLGLRRHFEGDPGHLIVRSVREPIPGGYGSRQYLVVFDGVPGGTGYLSELWQEGHFLDVLEKALEALVSCSCQKTADRDGCYRCLFAYQSQSELKSIKSSDAQATLRAILEKRDELQEIPTLSEVRLETKLESELELKFVEALKARAESKKELSWEERVRAGTLRWVLRTPDLAWEIVPQVDLGPSEGVARPCRPDFVIQPLNGDPGIRPIAVFCDGFAYHACPDQERGRIFDDIRKRASILDSGRYQMWSVSWKDVEDFENGPNQWSLSPTLNQTPDDRLAQFLQRLEFSGDRSDAKTSSMEMLLRYLSSPRPAEWQKLATGFALTWLSNTPQWMNPESGSALEERLRVESDRFRPGPAAQVGADAAAFTKAHFESWSALLVRATRAAFGKGEVDRVVLRLFDDLEARQDPAFEGEWREFLWTWNLLQFMDGVTAVSTELILDSAYEIGQDETASIAADAPEAEDSYGADSALGELLEFATAAGRPLILAVSAADLPLPEEEFELPVGGSACGAEPELAWEAAKVAVLSTRQAEDRPLFEDAGWQVFEHPVDSGELIDAIQSRS